MVIEKLLVVAVAVLSSVTRTDSVKVPAAEGVPLMVPVLALMLRPPGSEPDATEKVLPAVPVVPVMLRL
jgi:hypothetical protein